MTPEKQEAFRVLIDARVAEIESELATESDERKPIEPDVAIGRLSRMDSMQMQQMALAAQRRKQAAIGQLKQAIQRIDKGVYGRCALCQQDIAEERLEIMPEAVMCVSCSP